MRITILKLDEMATEMGISVRTLQRYIKDDFYFPHIKVAHTVRFVKEKVMPYWEAKKKEGCVIYQNLQQSVILEVKEAKCQSLR